MKRYFLIAATLIVLFSGCSLMGIQGSGIRVSEVRDLNVFTSLELEAAVNVNITFGDSQSVTITGDDNLLRIIKTNVVNGELIIRQSDEFNTSIGIKVDIVLVELNRVEIDGSGDITIPNINAATFTATIEGSGDINILDITATTFTAQINGSGDITATGVTEKLGVNVRGSGTINMYGVVSSDAVARVDGSGDINVYANSSLNAEINGSGDIYYKGLCTLTRSVINGSGDITSRN